MTDNLVTFVIACAALASLWACQRNIRHWWSHRQLPLILATADELPDVPEWPFRDRRWPRPYAEEAEPMAPKISAIYARLCRERSMIRRGVGQVAITVGGAWLGVRLPELGPSASAMSGSGAIPLLTSDYWANALPIFLILAGIYLLVSSAPRYDMAQSVYRRAAERPREESVNPTPHRSMRARLRSWMTG